MIQALTLRKILIVVIAMFAMGMISGCASMEFAPKDPYMYWYYPPELPEADRAVEAARKAGKDKECPAEFKAAEDLKNKAYEVYAACRNAEAIEMAKKATAMAKALCPAKPTCELRAAPKEIEKGLSATLTLTTSGNVQSAVLDGTEVATTGGTKTVSPASTTQYTAKVAGPAGSSTCSVSVTVATPPPPAPKPKVIDRLTIYVNFDFDKSNIRKADEAELKKAIDFVKKYSGSKVKLEGHTDSKGTEIYNQKLSEKRAEAVKLYLIKEGAVGKTMISTAGYGELKPIAPNKTKDGKDDPQGRAKNRRVEVLIISE